MEMKETGMAMIVYVITILSLNICYPLVDAIMSAESTIFLHFRHGPTRLTQTCQMHISSLLYTTVTI